VKKRFDEELAEVREQAKEFFGKNRVSTHVAACVTLAVVGLHMEAENIEKASGKDLRAIAEYRSHKEVLQNIFLNPNGKENGNGRSGKENACEEISGERHCCERVGKRRKQGNVSLADAAA